MESVGGVQWVGATSRVLSANLAQLSLSRSSSVEAKMSWAFFGVVEGIIAA